MGNINNFNFNKIDLRLDNSEYYDFYLSNDESPIGVLDNIISGATLIAEFDFNNFITYDGGIYEPTTMYSLSIWEDAVNTGLTLNNIGLTGLDNGLIPFEKISGDTSNTGLTDTLTGITLQVISGETSFILTPITGYTENYIYPIEILSSSTVGNYAQLCGGFYQGFYKIDENSYQTLPNRFEKGWTVEFWVNKNDINCTSTTGTTLNDNYTGNTGFLFYLGARAENKFWNVFEGLNTGSTSGCTSGCTDWCTIPKETDIMTTSGYPLSPPPLTITEITNNFLIYSRSDGQGCVRSTTGITKGTTICNYSGDSQPLLELDYERDLVASTNAFGLRVKEDGSIGYRALRFTCVTATTAIETTISSGITIEEDYSISGMVSDNQWNHITVKFVADLRYGVCKLQERGPRNGKLMFYINGRLKHVVNNFEEIIPKRLNEWHQKQEGVPFNISLGGGSQGLLESLTFDGQDPDDMGFPIEKYFAGSFIGGISKFRMYSEPLTWCEIKNNYKYESDLFNSQVFI